jgi:4a-hydroxytetrahydrobiopterin dehydratase
VIKYSWIEVPLILVSIFLLMQTAGSTNTNSADSRSNATIKYIENDDVKNSLIAVYNSTKPDYYVKLTDNQIHDALPDLPGWNVVDGKLSKTFVFGDFPTLFDFMFKVANVSQSLNHHPNMSSTFNTLTLDYDTWSIGHAISDMDIKAANRVEKLYGTGNYTEGLT